MGNEHAPKPRMEFRAGDKPPLLDEDTIQRIEEIEHSLLERRFLAINKTRAESYDTAARKPNSTRATLDELEHHFAKGSRAIIEDTRAIAEEIYALEKEGKTDELTHALTQEGTRQRFLSEKKKLDISDDPEKERIIIISFDVNNFKSINDDPSRGHNTGDEILKELVQKLHENLRPTDIVGRVGGDEFIIILTHVVANEAQHVADRIKELIQTVEDRAKGTITISAGMTTLAPNEALPFDEIKERADKAGSIAKIDGSEGVKMWNNQLESTLESDEDILRWATLAVERSFKRETNSAKQMLENANSNEQRKIAESIIKQIEEKKELEVQIEISKLKYKRAQKN